jgi:hypothetical protein
LLRQRATARAAVTSLESKLVELKNVLSRKQAALNRDKKLNAKPTATNKAKAARESKKYRQTHQQQLKNKAKTRKSGGHSLKNVVNNPKSGSIKEVEAAIQVVEKALTAAKARVIALG